jgi:MoxR-like ATPase
MTEPMPVEQQLEAFRDDFEALRREVGKRIVGHAETVEAVLTAAIAGGHALLEGPPGVGKTALVEALGEALQLPFQRIQFTPDLMPADLLGTFVVMETPQGRRTFEFQKGPLFSNLILADHINRGLPKTQAALLEAMEGATVSVSNETFQLPQPFFVLATQNPQEMEGSYPLPEPQLDRFLFKPHCPAPGAAEIEQILERTTEGDPPPVSPVCDGRRLLEMRGVARRVAIAPALRRWVANLVAATHADGPRAPELVRRFVSYGASPRAAQAIVLGGKIRAAAAGRPEATADDLRALASAALRHRLVLNFAGRAEGVAVGRIVDEVCQAASAN